MIASIGPGVGMRGLLASEGGVSQILRHGTHHFFLDDIVALRRRASTVGEPNPPE